MDRRSSNMRNESENSVEAIRPAPATVLHDDVDGRHLPIGAHLVTSQHGYEHHGIYVGSGMVVHYGGFLTGLNRRPVEQVPLACFADGRQVHIKSHSRPRYSPLEVVPWARSRLGEDPYRFANIRFEHFCEWCLSGISRSERIERLWAWPRDAVGAVVRRLKRIVAGVSAQAAASG